MATSTKQRVGIIIIAAVMALGTIGSFIAMIFANSNAQHDAKQQEQLSQEAQKAAADYQKKVEEYKKKVEEEGKAMAGQYYDILKPQEEHVAAFDGSKVKQLEKEDIIEGNGAEVKNASDMRAYYIGWNEKGKVFDTSINNDTLKPPISVANTIKGWQQGVIGMKIGGVRELTIPSEFAYGSKAQGEDIPANAPLKFIVLAVPKGDLAEPQIPEALIKAYTQGARR